MVIHPSCLVPLDNAAIIQKAVLGYLVLEMPWLLCTYLCVKAGLKQCQVVTAVSHCSRPVI